MGACEEGDRRLRSFGDAPRRQQLEGRILVQRPRNLGMGGTQLLRGPGPL